MYLKFQLRTASTDICFVLAIFRHTCTCTVQNNFLSHLPMRSLMNRDLETRPNQIIPDLCADHSPHILTAKPDQLQSVGPPDQTDVSLSDQQTRPDQTTFPQSTNQLDIFTARPASRQNANELLLIQVRSIPYGLGQGRLIYRALDEPCKAYFPHTFGLKSLDFYFRL